MGPSLFPVPLQNKRVSVIYLGSFSKILGFFRGALILSKGFIEFSE